MIAKFPGRCKACGGAIAAGTDIQWSRADGARHKTLAECQVAQAAKAAQPPAPHVDGAAVAIAQFLQAAQARGLKWPKVRFLAPAGRGELRLSIAGPTSKAPGAINVILNGEYFGRILTDGATTFKLAEDAAVLAELRRIAAEPAKAAAAYGALMGRCSFCNLTLTDAGSVAVGYGPVCAEKYGLPHHHEGTPAVAVA